MEFNQGFDYSVLDSLINRNIRFAVYRQEKQQDIHLILQTGDSFQQFDSLADLNESKGFVIVPFHTSTETPIVLIHPDIHLTGEEAIFSYISENDFQPNLSHIDVRKQSSASSLEQYTHNYHTFHKALNERELQKLVLSRTFDTKRKNNFSAGVVFCNACKKYNSDFVFLCNTPETGTWMGISPELLLSKQNEVYKTVALAGTKKVLTSDWDEKNRREQQIVVDYMQQQLNEVGVKITQEGPFEVQAGEVVHLKTEFSFKLQNDNHIGNLLHLLHPSPAVCGFPKKEAFDFILKNESYNRRYYSGFVGPLNINAESSLYMNLRCMQVGQDVLRLYAGGGLLPSSEIEKEWDETECKLQTIRSVIN